MQINNPSSNYWLQKLQQDMQTQLASLQQLPSTGQDPQAQSSPSTSSTTPAGAAATASAGSTTGAGLLGSDALNWLISSEQSTPAALANDIIQAVNPGGDSINLQQVASATGESTSQLSGAFSAIDTNGDGQLSQSELATALTNALQNAQGSGEPGGVGSPRHHHHHHGGGESQLAANSTGDSSSASSGGSTVSSAVTDSSGTGSTTTNTGG
jgi:hypothetical protein